MSDYRTDEETVEVIGRWWRENGTFLLVTVVLVVAGTLGWTWWQAQTQARAEGAAALYSAWERAPASEAQAIAERLREEHPRSAYVALISLDAARRAMEAEDSVLARSALEQVLELGVSRQIEDVARIRLARVELDAGDPAAALARLEDVRSGVQLSLVEELRGDALRALEREEEAVAAYERALVTAETPRPLLRIKHEDLTGALAGGSE